MFKFCQRLIIIILCLFPLRGISQGLQFYSNIVSISDRTSYEVFANRSPTFTDKLSISFDLSLSNNNDFGYIFWLKDIENKISYSLTIANYSEELNQLKFNIQGEENLITMNLNKSDLGNGRWQTITINLFSNSDSVSIRVGDKENVVLGRKLATEFKPQIFFGRKEPLIDVPEFAIRNLSIAGNNKAYFFDFTEKEGEDVHDLSGKLMGKVENPNWLINASYHWKLRYSHVLPTMSVVNYDPTNERMILLNKDSLIFFEFQTNSAITKTFENELLVPIQLGSSFIDTATNSFYVYEVNSVPTDCTATIAALDLEKLEWTANSTLQLPQQRHHHDGYFDSEAMTYMIFGGFGNQRFSNQFDLYDVKSDHWSILDFGGDTIFPRFFSGMTSKDENELLIYGGKGNKSGDQTLGRTYYYDCYSINLLDHSIQKLWDLNLSNSDLVSTRNMVLSDDKQSFYTLCYPEYISNSFLKLYHFSLVDGEFEILGDSIPIFSEKIESNANLYSSKSTRELYCFVQEFLADSTSKVSIYSLADPPISEKKFYDKNEQGKKISYTYLTLIILVVIVLYFLMVLYKNRLKKQRKFEGQRDRIRQNLDFKEVQSKKRKNAIYLFGEFIVCDRNGKDISYLFSPKIKQLFLLILLNSVKDRDGVSSENIYASIWPEKEPEKAKNSKGVSLNQIRSILSDLDGIELCYDKSHFKLDITEALYCDYMVFNTVFNDFQLHEFNTEENIKKIIAIVSEGSFLRSAENEHLDKFKNEFESEVQQILPDQMEKNFKEQKYALVIQLAKITYYTDSLNELAFQHEILSLVKLDLRDLAKKRYNAYIVKFNNENNDDFPYTFRDICNLRPLLHKKD